MTGQAHWLPLVFIAFATLPVAYLWIADWRAERRYKVEQRNVRCRARGNRLAHLTLVRDGATCEPMGVRECSAAPVEHCGKSCLPLFAHAS